MPNHGKGGRKPKPTKLKKLEGNRGKRKLSKKEPEPTLPPDVPEFPEWIQAEAKKEWIRVAPELYRLGLLTEVDTLSFAMYCESYADYKAAKLFIQKHGDVYPIKDDKGNVKYLQQVPQVSIANKALANVRALCAEFGMTPSSRGSMELPEAGDDDDKLLKLLKTR